MKKIFLMMAAFAITMAVSAQKVKMTPTVGDNAISINVENDFELYGVGFKFYLPEGVTLGTVYDEDEEADVPAVIKNMDRCKNKHVVDVRKTGDGKGWSVNVYNAAFKLNEGEIVSIKLEGEMKGIVKFDAIAFTNAEAVGFTQEALELDLSGTGIEGINAASENENAPMYNLAGQRVSRVQKGIFIQNGKKVLK